MTINPDDPWYPNPYKLGEMCPHNIMGGCPGCRGVPIRLKLAETAMHAYIASGDMSPNVTEAAFAYADRVIERANRDEGVTMASDGGPAYPFPTHDERGACGQFAHGGMSVRDGFAMAIASQEDWPMEGESAILIYDWAQRLTDEKLRRDKADRDEGTAG